MRRFLQTVKIKRYRERLSQRKKFVENRIQKLDGGAGKTSVEHLNCVI